MRRTVLTLIILSLSGCVITMSAPVADPPPPAVVEVWFGGEHAIPAPMGGGWCWVDGPHVHDYFPDPIDAYAFSDGFYYWRAPLVFTYYGGHPMPGGGWCPIGAPHRHDYFPPYGAGFTWRGSGWAYGGAWTASRPPPPGWWTWAPPRPPPPAAVRPPAPAQYRPPPPPMRRPVPPPRPHDDGDRHDRGPDRAHDQERGKTPPPPTAPVPAQPPTARPPPPAPPPAQPASPPAARPPSAVPPQPVAKPPAPAPATRPATPAAKPAEPKKDDKKQDPPPPKGRDKKEADPSRKQVD